MSINDHVTNHSNIIMDAARYYDNRHLDISMAITEDLKIALPNGTPWALTSIDGIGYGRIYNTPLSTNQLTVALALSRHTAVEELIRHPTDSSHYTKLAHLVSQNVLKGFRILDLGCGLIPIFARTLRALGATVYTVDVAAAKDFKVAEECKDTELAHLERSNHIQIDFNSSNAAQTILRAAGAQAFDYVTSAHPMIMSGLPSYEYPSKHLIDRLTNEGGLYFNATTFQPDEMYTFKPLTFPSRSDRSYSAKPNDRLKT